MVEILIFQNEVVCVKENNTLYEDKTKINEILSSRNKNELKIISTLIAPKVKKATFSNSEIILEYDNSQKRFSSHLEKAIFMAIKKNDYFYNNNTPIENKKTKLKVNIQARDYQEQCVEKMLENKKGIVYAPTGSGKTNIIAYLISKRPITTLIIVPSQDLVEQTAERIKSIVNVDCGIISGKIKNKLEQIKPVTVTTWQSLKGNILSNVKDKFKMIIVDECHHSSANILFNTIKELSNQDTFLYGVSATPYRSSQNDEMKIFELFGNNLLHRVDIDYLYENNYLVRPEIYIIQTGAYTIKSIMQSQYLTKTLKTKKSDTQSFEQFVNEVAKIPYFVVNNLQNKHNAILKETPNGNLKPIDSFDITKAKDFLLDCFSSEKDDNAKKELLTALILKKINIDQIDYAYPLALKENQKNEFIDFFQRSYSIYVENNFKLSEDIQKWDFAVKIGFLKKHIDNDIFRQAEVIKQISNNLDSRVEIKAVILANTKDYAEKLFQIFSEKKYNLENMTFFYLDGASKDKKSVFDSIKNINNDNFILVSTTDLIKEGIDIPPVNLVFCASPIFNPLGALYNTEQIVGRAIRPFENKNKSEIFIFDCYTNDFSNKRDIIFNTINNNLKPAKLMVGKIDYAIKHTIEENNCKEIQKCNIKI